MSWALSVSLASRHYRTALVTDEAGKKLLVDDLGLRFDDVSTTIDKRLSGTPPEFWSASKLEALRAIGAGAIAIDYDVYLWRPLPQRIESAGIAAQSPERIAHFPGYNLDAFDEQLSSVLPNWNKRVSVSSNCGIVGGTDSEFFESYLDTNRELLESCSFPNKHSFISIVLEQYLLAWCAERANKTIEHLFRSSQPSRSDADEAGYTHLFGFNKLNRANCHSIESRLRTEFPDLYARCIEIGNRRGDGAANRARAKLVDKIVEIKSDTRAYKLKVFAINLKSRPDRLQHLLIQLRAAAITEYTVIEGITPDDVTPRWFCTPTESAATMSHVKALRAGIATGDEMFLVVEDDIALCDNFLARLMCCLDELPSDWDCLMAHGHDWKPDKPNGDCTRRSQCTILAGCYLVRRRFAKRLVLLTETGDEPFDFTLAMSAEKNNVFTCHPYLARQNWKLGSSIAHSSDHHRMKVAGITEIPDIGLSVFFPVLQVGLPKGGDEYQPKISGCCDRADQA